MTEHITVSRELLRQVRDLITFMQEWVDAVPADARLPAMPGFDGDWAAGVKADLRAALEQPAVEPVARYIGESPYGSMVQLFDDLRRDTDLYTAPPPADVLLLTEEEIVAAIASAKKIPAAYAGWVRDQRIEYGRSIEQAVRQKAGLK